MQSEGIKNTEVLHHPCVLLSLLFWSCMSWKLFKLNWGLKLNVHATLFTGCTCFFLLPHFTAAIATTCTANRDAVNVMWGKKNPSYCCHNYSTRTLLTPFEQAEAFELWTPCWFHSQPRFSSPLCTVTASLIHVLVMASLGQCYTLLYRLSAWEFSPTPDPESTSSERLKT